MRCYWCNEDIATGDDYIYLNVDGGLSFHYECKEEFINDITQIHTNDEEDF